jgi:adenylate cyclase
MAAQEFHEIAIASRGRPNTTMESASMQRHPRITKDISGVVAWLDDGIRTAPTPQEMVEQLCGRLVAVGIPLDRAAIFVTILHPDIAGRMVIWRRGQPVEIGEAGYDLVESEQFLTNPVVCVRRTGMALRRRLDDDAVGGEYPFLGELRGKCFTDYLASPLRFTNGEIHVANWVTRQLGGFDDDDLRALTAVARPLARIVEIWSLRRTEATLLETYIGRQAAARVLAGHIRRGDTESIHAAIWLSDLRGFTRLADRLPPRELTALLNRYFDCQVPAIEAHGGEVLKFMGDGLLAIFPTAEGGPTRVCAAALAAAREARANILALERRTGMGRSAELPFSLALHIGEVLYGNVGGGGRLDFTVIGPAINLAARLERLARELGCSIVTSAVFAGICGERLTPLGSYALRDISAVQPAFGLPEENEPAGSKNDDATLGITEACPAFS